LECLKHSALSSIKKQLQSLSSHFTAITATASQNVQYYFKILGYNPHKLKTDCTNCHRYLPPVSTAQGELVAKFAAGVVDTGGNLPPVSLTPVAYNGNNIRLQTP
jgi:hypothetical protein